LGSVSLGSVTPTGGPAVRKRTIYIAAAVVASSFAAPVAAHAAYVWTPVAAVNVDADRGEVFVDLSDDPSSNPTPEHGYVIVHGDGTITCGETGGPAAGQSGPDPQFIDSGECQPVG